MSKKLKCHQSYQEDGVIFSIVETAKSFWGLTEANLYFQTLCDHKPGFAQLGNNVYHYKDYYINLEKRFLMAGHSQCLMDLARLELSCLPQGIALIWLDNDEDMVLITRIRGSERHRLIPYNEYPTALSVQTRQQLLADVDRLLYANQAIGAVTERKESWYILEGEERIIFSVCQLVFVPDKAKPAYRGRVLESLGLSK